MFWLRSRAAPVVATCSLRWFRECRHKPSTGDRRILLRVVLVNAVNRGELLAQVAHVIVRAMKVEVSVIRGVPSKTVASDSRLPDDTARVACRVVYCPLEAVEPVAIIELFHWLRGRVVPQIPLGVNW